MNNLTISDGNIKITSLEIAEWTGKRHADVMRDIRKEVEELKEVTERIFALSEYKDSTGRILPMYVMDKKGVMQLALKYDAISRYKCIERLEQLEQPKQYTLKESLQMNLQLLEDNEKLQKEKEIADKRAFTSMGKLGGITKEVNRLKEKVGEIEGYSTILAIENKHKIKVNWRAIKAYCEAQNLLIKEVPCERYGKVNSYPIQAFKVLYNAD